MMLEKLGALINLFRKGSEVSNVELWKTGGISVAALSATLGAVLQFSDAFGLHISVTPDQINGIAIGVVSLVGIVLPLITSKRAGILPAKPDNAVAIEDHSFTEPVPAVAAPAQSAIMQPQLTTKDQPNIWLNPPNPGG